MRKRRASRDPLERPPDGAATPEPSPDTKQAAFERYVLPDIEVLLRVARSLTHNDADAEDLVQDTLIRAYRSIDRFDGRYPRAWLLTILRNTHINRNRRQRPELLRDGEGAKTRFEQVPAPERTDAGIDELFDTEVQVALDSLDHTFRGVVELVDIDGLSYAEAADALGIPTGTVMSRLHRARTRIREHLDRAGAAPRATTKKHPMRSMAERNDEEVRR